MPDYGFETEVSTFAPASSAWAETVYADWTRASKEAPSRQDAVLYSADIERAIATAISLFFLDRARLERSLRQAHTGEYRPLREVVSGALCPPDARSGE